MDKRYFTPRYLRTTWNDFYVHTMVELGFSPLVAVLTVSSMLTKYDGKLSQHPQVEFVLNGCKVKAQTERIAQWISDGLSVHDITKQLEQEGITDTDAVEIVIELYYEAQAQAILFNTNGKVHA